VSNPLLCGGRCGRCLLLDPQPREDPGLVERRVAELGIETVVSNTFARVYVAMGVLLVMLVLYRVLAYMLVRRLRQADRTHAGAATASVSSSSSPPPPATSATGAALPRTPGYEAVRDYFYADPDAGPARGPRGQELR
jgi:hypothetical protein